MMKTHLAETNSNVESQTDVAANNATVGADQREQNEDHETGNRSNQ